MSCPSGWRSLPRKQVSERSLRGFESLTHRKALIIKESASHKRCWFRFGGQAVESLLSRGLTPQNGIVALRAARLLDKSHLCKGPRGERPGSLQRSAATAQIPRDERPGTLQSLHRLPNLALKLRIDARWMPFPGETLQWFPSLPPQIKNHCTMDDVSGWNLASIRKSGPEIKNWCSRAVVTACRRNHSSLRRLRKSRNTRRNGYPKEMKIQLLRR